jgi:hypothetical protein
MFLPVAALLQPTVEKRKKRHGMESSKAGVCNETGPGFFWTQFFFLLPSPLFSQAHVVIVPSLSYDRLLMRPHSKHTLRGGGEMT